MVRFEEDGGEPERLAPVIPLFAAAVPPTPTADDEWHPVGRSVRPAASVERVDPPPGRVDDRAEARDDAERVLLKRLRTRSLSVREARGVLGAHEIDPDDVDELIDAFERRGYLDDAALADQLMRSAVERKGQGRQVISQTFAKRGIPRDVADAALAELPDDDAERALDFARQKVRSMGSLDRDAALRRLHGQLARRGFPGSVAMTAARTALDESGGRSSSSVRFR